jgi:hypothetical protein
MSAMAGCGNSEDPSDRPGGDIPSEVSMVASDGFDSPLDAVASPDGSTFYFTAFTVDDESQAAIFSVAANGGPVTHLYVGAPLAYPTGLVLSCDGSTLIVSDKSETSDDDDNEVEDAGKLYSIDVQSGVLSALDAAGIDDPGGLALSDDCQTLYISGAKEDGTPALFRMPISGGAVEVVYEGSPLVAPTGMYVDQDEVAWVLDQFGEDGMGVLYAITETGDISTVVEGLAIGTPGGCSLNSAGDTAFMPTQDEFGVSQLTTVSLDSAELGVVEAANIIEPAGLRTARNASVFVMVDHEGNSIFTAK